MRHWGPFQNHPTHRFLTQFDSSFCGLWSGIRILLGEELLRQHDAPFVGQFVPLRVPPRPTFASIRSSKHIGKWNDQWMIQVIYMKHVYAFVTFVKCCKLAPTLHLQLSRETLLEGCSSNTCQNGWLRCPGESSHVFFPTGIDKVGIVPNASEFILGKAIESTLSNCIRLVCPFEKSNFNGENMRKSKK